MIIISVISFHSSHFHKVSFILKALCHALRAKLSTKWSCTCIVNNWHGGCLPNSHTHCSLPAKAHSAGHSASRHWLCRLSSLCLLTILLFWRTITKDSSIITLTHTYFLYPLFSTNEFNEALSCKTLSMLASYPSSYILVHAVWWYCACKPCTIAEPSRVTTTMHMCNCTRLCNIQCDHALAWSWSAVLLQAKKHYWESTVTSDESVEL